MEVKEYFVATDMEQLERDYHSWLSSFGDYYEKQERGYRFPLIYNRDINKIILYDLQVYYDEEGHVYIMQVSALKEYRTYEDAACDVDGVIAYYVANRIERFR